MKNKKISTIAITMLFVAALNGCTDTQVSQTTPDTNTQTETETVQTDTDKTDSKTTSEQSITFETPWYKVSMKAPNSWRADSKTLTLTKGEEIFWFDQEYSPGEPQNPNTQTSTVTTQGGKVLKITVITDKDDASQGALVFVEDNSTLTKNPSFYFSFVTPSNEVNQEFHDIVKTISWERINL